MIRIALCMTHPTTRRLVSEMLYMIEVLKNFEFCSFEPGTDFTDNKKLFNAHIIFMCTEFNSSYGENGFKAAKALRDMGCVSNIVFMTTQLREVYNSFKLRPFRYILKPIDFEEVKEAVISSIAELNASTILQIKINKSLMSLYLDEIVYMEADKRQINIRTTNNYYVVIENLTYYEELLMSRCFFRTHRTYIVNFRHIQTISGYTIEMKNGEYVILSRHKKAAFDKAYDSYVRARSV